MRTITRHDNSNGRYATVIDLSATNIGDGALPSTVMVGLLPVDVKDNNHSTGVDDVSKKAKESDIGYTEDFWIMAPLQGPLHPDGPLPPGEDFDNLTKISIGMEDGGSGEFSIANATPDPAQLALDGDLHDVLWKGAGNGIDSNETLNLKINGGATGHPLPVKVKTMKYREVKIAVWPVKHPSDPDPFILTQTFKDHTEQRLNEVFGYQLNAWCKVDFKSPGNAFEYTDGLFASIYLATPWGQKFRDLHDNRKDATADINVYLIKNAVFLLGGADGEFLTGFAADPAINGWQNYPNTCFISLSKRGLSQNGQIIAEGRDYTDVTHTIAHEIGHLLVGLGHPDLESGVAPLLGTDRTKRLMCSGGNSNNNSIQLVKKEWDKAEEWFKNRENGDN
jgi:hypothetical protein